MDQPVPIDRAMILLGFAFAAAWIVTAGMAAHFPRILEATGASPRASHRRRRVDRAGAGRRADAGGERAGALPSAGVRATGDAHASRSASR